jgi:hypothetical protein
MTRPLRSLIALAWLCGASPLAHAAAQWTLQDGEGRTLAQAQGPAQIEIAARAGDTLFGDMDPIQRKGFAEEPEPRVRDAQSQALLLTASGQLVFRVPQDGVYRIEFDQISRFTLWRLPADDPRVDPGLAPTSLRIDLAALGITPTRAQVGADPLYLGSPPPTGWPAHLELYSGKPEPDRDFLYAGDGRFWLGLFPALGIRRLYGAVPGHPATHDPLRALDALLAAAKPIKPAADLPFFPGKEAEIFFAAEAKTLTVGCFAAVRYVARFSQEDDAPYPALSYIVQGLSRDKRFFLSVEAAVAPPALAGFAAAPDGLSKPARARYKTALAQLLSSSPERFTPSVVRLDQALQSLQGPCGP